MVQIKGTVLLDTIAAVKARSGESELAKIVGLLGGEARQVFQGAIDLSGWYSLDAFVDFLEVDVRETANCDREVLTKRSEVVIESQLRGVYGIFVRHGTPGFVINRIASVHEAYFKGIQIIPEIEYHKATIKYVGFQKHHDIMQYVIIGFFRKALELCGAKQVALSFSVPIAKGTSYSEVSITWE
jgi:hypothetical protein